MAAGASPFAPDKVLDSRCSLLRKTPETIQIEGQTIGHWFLQVETQPEVGTEGYDTGAEILTEVFHQQISKFLENDLDSKGREIIIARLDGATVSDY